MARAVQGGPDDGGTVAGYLPVSPLAVAAGLLGGVAALAVVSPLFWVVPLVGTAVSWAALVDVGRPGAPKAGRLAALVGLALSVGFGTQAVAAAATAEWIARGRVEAAARAWLEAIASGRLADARAMGAPDVAGAIDRVAACGEVPPAGVRYRGRDEITQGRVVRAAVGGCVFDILLDAAPARGGVERFSVARCDAVTPSGN